MDLYLSSEKTALIVVMLANLLTPFMSSAMNLAIPAIGTEFSASTRLLSWLVASYSLTAAGFMLPFGRLADIVGRRKVFVTGMLLFSIFTLLSGTARSIQSMIFFRTCQGIASSMIFSTGTAIVTSVYPLQARGRALGLTASCAYIGMSLGPVLGGGMSHHFGWRSIFYLTTLIGIFATLLATWGLRAEWADSKGERFDLIGSTCYILALAATLYGLSSVFQEEWAKYILGTGLVLMVIFLCYETKQDYPIFQVGLFRRNTIFAFSNLAAMISYSATFAIGFLISLDLQVVRGYDSQVAGLVLLSQPLIMAILSPFTGTLSDRIEPRLIASWGMGITTLGLFFLIFITADTTLWTIVADLVLLGIGSALFAVPNNNAIMGSVGKELYGVASSTLGTMRLVGGAVSMAVVTSILSIYIGDSDLGRDYAHMLVAASRTAYILLTVICFAGILASLAGRNLKSRH